MSLEEHFIQFRKNTIGWDAKIQTPYGIKPLIYADWIASGRLYAPIEELIQNKIGPMVANTHSESSDTGMIMTNIYKMSHKIIKSHVNASSDDIIMTYGFGMTSVVNKLQRILGLRIPEQAKQFFEISPEERPVVFLTHMEHHSNHTSWLETIADVVVLEPNHDLMVDPDSLTREIVKYKDRPLKIGSFSACSNVTGIRPPYYKLARIMHENNGLCFVDFAASAPYTEIDMHPSDPLERLDAIFFSPHKFLGGPGSSGVLIMNSALNLNNAPDTSGGGTVDWTNRWGKYKYVDDLETREDGGTPGFLQSIRAALAIKIKEQMGCNNIKEREDVMLKKVFGEFRQIPGLNILADNEEERIGVISFYLTDVHFNLVVRLLNDHFGIQVRGGCSCAGTYGHYLLHVDYATSCKITSKINQGDLSEKPGWIRLSLHPTMTDSEIDYIIDAVRQVAENAKQWGESYHYDSLLNDFVHNSFPRKAPENYIEWFEI
ncbi:MAG: selenocysteine lyase [Bacteroidetes bacterium GWF2_40_14]|nr:MAG: selenocysteine lyase [Bacteroidetes bacterium GWF2_40_14]